MDNRKNWTSQQNELRLLLTSKSHFEQGIHLFLQQHAAVHAACISAVPEASGTPCWSLYDEVLAGLTDQQIKTVPRSGMNSIAWLLWHITRIEDLSINFLVFEQPQVLLSATAAWLPRLGLASPDVGASMNEAEVLELSDRICVPALKEYREAVGRSTRAGVGRLQAAQLKQVIPDVAIQQLRDEGSISRKGEWLAEYYTGRTRGFFLTRTATSHNFIHLNEAGRVRAKLLRPINLKQNPF
jgi:hypothetical protein